MDPNANLAEQLRIAARINQTGFSTEDDAARLAELIDALNEWIENGGHLPLAWVR